VFSEVRAKNSSGIHRSELWWEKGIQLRRESGRKEIQVEQVETTTGYDGYGKISGVGRDESGTQFFVTFNPLPTGGS
jgi:hypothetical protein